MKPDHNSSLHHCKYSPPESNTFFLPGFSTKLSNPTKSTIMSFLINCLPYPSNQAELFADDYCKTEEAEKVMSDKIELEANFHNSFSVESPSRIAISSPGHHYCFESEKKRWKWKENVKSPILTQFWGRHPLSTIAPISPLGHTPPPHSAPKAFFTSSDDGRKILISCSWFSCFFIICEFLSN